MTKSPEAVYGNVAEESLAELRDEVGHKDIELQQVEVNL